MYDLIQSKRFLSAMAYVLALALVFVVPQFQPAEADLAVGLTAVFSLLIIGYSAEDLANAIGTARTIASQTRTPYDDLIVDIVEQIVKEVLLKAKPDETNS